MKQKDNNEGFEYVSQRESRKCQDHEYWRSFYRSMSILSHTSISLEQQSEEEWFSSGFCGMGGRQGRAKILLFISVIMLLTQVIGPIKNVKKQESAGEKDSRNDINLLGAELEIAHPFQQTIASSDWNFTMEQSRRGDHWRAFDSAHQWILQRKKKHSLDLVPRARKRCHRGGNKEI